MLKILAEHAVGIVVSCSPTCRGEFIISEGFCSLSQCAASEDRHRCQPHTESDVPASAVPAATQGQKDLKQRRHHDFKVGQNWNACQHCCMVATSRCTCIAGLVSFIWEGKHSSVQLAHLLNNVKAVLNSQGKLGEVRSSNEPEESCYKQKTEGACHVPV